MAIVVNKIEDVRTINKPWGWERWLADKDSGFRYVLKEIFIEAPHKSSLQFHEYKQETIYIKEGNGLLHMSDEDINLQSYMNEKYSSKNLEEIVKNVRTVPLSAGDVYHVQPGQIHRVEAVTDLLFIEASTVELDDIIRLKDDTNRPSGKINSEHSK